MPNTKINIAIHGILGIVDGGNGVGWGDDACRDDACIVSTMVATNPMERSKMANA